MTRVIASVTGLAEHVAELRAGRDPGHRLVVGIVGEPGSGKSTVAEALASALRERGVATAVVPMDGFHLANVELERLGLADRKGAPETFDAPGYAALLHRLRTVTGETVYCPAYERSIEEAVAGSIPVSRDTTVVLTEGNYLLVPEGDWAPVRGLLDLSCAVEVDPELRRERLTDRHVRFGRSRADAVAWMESVDEPNAALTRSTLPLADVRLRLS